MLHHVSIGVPNVERAAEFYDAVLGVLGYSRVKEFLPHAIGYGEKVPVFWIGLPLDKGRASAGNGVHIAFAASSRLAVDAFHRAALSRGGSDEGAPGPRHDYSPDYYGAFVRDPYGNKLEAVIIAGIKPKPVEATEKPAAKPKGKAKAAKRAAKPTPPKRGARKPPGRRSPVRARQSKRR